MNVFKRIIYNNVVPFVGSIKNSSNQIVNVIYYHDVVNDNGYSYMNIEFDKFKKQMEYIRDNGYETLTFSQLNEKEFQSHKRKRVLITFDDGWLSNYTSAFELLKSLGIKFNVFLAAGLIEENSDYMNWSMVKEMSESGICEFGAHTFDHIDIDNCKDIDFERQIGMTNKIIYENTGKYPYDFCFPKGVYNREVLDYFINKSPYTRIYTSKNMYSYYENNKIIFGRNAISNDEPFGIFVNKLKGNYNVFQWLRGKKNG